MPEYHHVIDGTSGSNGFSNGSLNKNGSNGTSGRNGHPNGASWFLPGGSQNGSTNGHISGFSNGSSAILNGSHDIVYSNGKSNGYSNGHGNGYKEQTNGYANGNSEEPYDLICVGFGPASLAIAIALYERHTNARVLFIERQPKFAWHSGMLLPGSRMQISFIKDLATLRNPRSEFTFINYLHQKDRLVAFTNLGTFLPLREEYNDYMSWCASHFEDYVRYGQECVSVSPTEMSGKTVKSWEVVSKSIETGEILKLSAKHVVIAVGGKPRIPDVFPQNPLNERIIHSSRYSTAIPSLLSDRDRAYKIAVVGGGQSAAEIFNDIHSQYPNSKTSLIIKGSALRPSDDSPFVNEIFNPDRVDNLYTLPADIRRESIIQDRATNYGVVRLELIERLYDTIYHQRLKNPDESTWQHHIVPLQEVVGCEENKLGEMHLKLRNTRTGTVETTIGYDAIIVATGYMRNVHETLLKPAKSLMKGNACTVGRNYRVQFSEGAVADDAGIWLQGCCESTHGLSDTLLSILSVRGGEIVDSIFGKEPPSRIESKSKHATVIEKSVRKYADAMVMDILNGMGISGKVTEMV